MKFKDVLLATGCFTSVFTVIKVSDIIATSHDSGFACGMFFAGAILTLIQLVTWAVND